MGLVTRLHPGILGMKGRCGMKKEKVLFEGRFQAMVCNGRVHFVKDYYGRDHHEYDQPCDCKQNNEIKP
jgi:hypothetical protein